MTIKATKTSLYKLVAEHWSLPPMKSTSFSKLARQRSYWLEWQDEKDGRPREAYFTAVCGAAQLRIGYKYCLSDDPTSLWFRVSIEDLRAHGMLDE